MSNDAVLPVRQSTETCEYTFDPSRAPDARLRTSWKCPHDAHAESDRCVFHMTGDERATADVSPEMVADAMQENLASQDSRLNEYVGADLPFLSLTYQEIDGDTNHVINLQHATVEGIDITHGHLEQGLNVRGATIGTFKLEDAEVSGRIKADGVTVTGSFDLSETQLHEEVSFRGATFEGEFVCDEATFYDDAHFPRSTFHDEVHFRNAETYGTSHVLGDHVSFREATFAREASFRETNFEYATFEGATFEALADFEYCIFDGDAVFVDASFEEMGDFDEARFFGDVTFGRARFDALAEFSGVEFNGDSRTTDDDVCFEDAVFDAEADFVYAQFRYANFHGATFGDEFVLSDAVFRGELDCMEATVDGETVMDACRFEEPADFSGTVFDDELSALEATFAADCSFEASTFGATASFDETRFGEDATFELATFEATASFRGSVFEGDAKVLEENASFDEATFLARADFRSSRFTNGSFQDVTFRGPCEFRDAEFTSELEFRVDESGDETYVDLSRAHVEGGRIVEDGADPVPYDLTKATIGDIALEGEGGDYELLDQFRICLTEFDAFDFSDHHSALERSDWVIHDFVGEDLVAPVDVEMTPAHIEETYRRAQGSADAVGDTPASREFEFKRYYFDRKKNVDLIVHDYSLDLVTKLKKGASVGLNYFMQYTCGYGNRLPRIAALTFLLPALFGVGYALPLEPFATTGPPSLDVDRSLNVAEGIYYSYISFSTIGYGDISPVGWAARTLAASQGMLNGLLFTLLTFTLFKRVLGGS